MKKKFLFSLLLLTLVALPLIGACAQEAPSPAPAPAPTTTPAPVPTTSPAPAPQAIELRFSAFMPPVAAQVKIYGEWAQKISEASNGQVKITIFPAGTLVPPQDIISGVKKGIADIGDLTLGGQIDQYPLNPTLLLPFMPLGDADNGYKIWMALIDKFPEMKNEYKDFKVLGRFTTGAYALHTAKKQAKLPEDLKGVKIMCSGGLADVMSSIGASPIFLQVMDWYGSLERGLLEAMWQTWQGVYETKSYQFLPYHTVFPSGISLGQSAMIMNLDSWNKLPPDVQKTMDDLYPWINQRVLQIQEIEGMARAIEGVTKEGHTIVTLTPDEEKAWRDAAAPIIEAYLAKIEGRGYPVVRAIYEEALRLAESSK